MAYVASQRGDLRSMVVVRFGSRNSPYMVMSDAVFQERRQIAAAIGAEGLNRISARIRLDGREHEPNWEMMNMLVEHGVTRDLFLGLPIPDARALDSTTRSAYWDMYLRASRFPAMYASEIPHTEWLERIVAATQPLREVP
eukprot:5698690-Pleurochrysis_carterae.AAC.2